MRHVSVKMQKAGIYLFRALAKAWGKKEFDLIPWRWT